MRKSKRRFGQSTAEFCIAIAVIIAAIAVACRGVIGGAVTNMINAAAARINDSVSQ